MAEPYRSEINLDYNKFFYNAKHTNIYGSEQVTKFMSDYLVKKGYVEDRRGDKKYSEYDNLVKTMHNLTDKKYSEMQNALAAMN